LVQIHGASSSPYQNLTFEEKLRLLLEPDQPQESIQIAKTFLSNLGTANFDDPAILEKTREYATFLQQHLTGEELAIANNLVTKLEAVSLLQENARQLEELIHKKHADRADVETKTIEVRDQLRERKAHLAKCDSQLAELASFKADIERKIAEWQASRARHTEKLVQEVSVAEGLMQALTDAHVDLKKTTSDSEDQILEYQRTLLDIASLGRRL
jgi:cell division septum initiation protein DivIVA